jgi:ATP-binding cassette subfamily B protein
MKAQEFSVHDFRKIGTASMITRATGDVTAIGQITVMFLQMLLPAPVMAIAGLFLAFAKDQLLAFMILAAMVLFLLFSALFGKKVVPLFKLIQVKMDHITRTIQETIIGVRVIRAFHREGYEKERIDASAADYAENSIRINKLFAIFPPIAMLIINACVIGIVWVGGKRTAAGFIQIGDIMALVEYCFLILYALMMGITMFLYIPRAQACADRINEVLDMVPEIQDNPAAHLKRDAYAHLEFCNVTFQYPNAEEAVLKNISFESRSGEVTAVIGGTGSGKSTIASLILRFFDIQSGSIKIGGTDIRELPQKQLRDKIGYVPQKAFLFSGTIESNIRYGKEDAREEEIRHAAQVAQAHEFIAAMLRRYHSYVAQGGNNFSGGQKQRLAIARALVRAPEIYIFDDSFSALDFKTDARLRKALKKEIGNSTVIIVAQRISTIMDADRIVVLDDGEIAGIGTHGELMKHCVVYQQIAASQLSEDELAGA